MAKDAKNETQPTVEETVTESPTLTAGVTADTPSSATTLGETPTAKTFTQDELNQILAQRLQQERGKFADYESIKAQNAQLAADRQAEQERVAQLQQRNQELTATSQQTAVEAEIAKAAGKIGLDPVAAIKLADPKAYKLEEGKLTNAAEIAKGIAEQFPGLTKRPVPPVAAVNPADAGDRPVTPEVKEANWRSEFFGGGKNGFWSGGGVRLPTQQE